MCISPYIFIQNANRKKLEKPMCVGTWEMGNFKIAEGPNFPKAASYHMTGSI